MMIAVGFALIGRTRWAHWICEPEQLTSVQLIPHELHFISYLFAFSCSFLQWPFPLYSCSHTGSFFQMWAWDGIASAMLPQWSTQCPDWLVNSEAFSQQPQRLLSSCFRDALSALECCLWLPLWRQLRVWCDLVSWLLHHVWREHGQFWGSQSVCSQRLHQHGTMGTSHSEWAPLACCFCFSFPRKKRKPGKRARAARLQWKSINAIHNKFKKLRF